MDRSEVKAIVERELWPLMQRLGIPHWTVRVIYKPAGAEDGTLQHGDCTRLLDYHNALITLNPESFEDEAAALKTLRHELFHVVLAPFDLYSSGVDRTVGEDHTAKPALDRMWDHSVEQAVIALERMYHGLTKDQ